MLYRIGEVAEMLGLTKGGVRFLEEKDLLKSVRDEHNGYRYYDGRSLARLHLIRAYTACGFTLEEATALLLKEERDELLSEMDKKDRELAEQIAVLEDHRARLKRQRAIVDKAFSVGGEPEVIECEALYYFGISGKYAPENGQPFEIRKRWIDGAPFVGQSLFIMDKEGTPAFGYGGCVTVSDAERLKIPTEGAALLPAGLCAVAGIRAAIHSDAEDGNTVQKAVREIFAWLDKNGWAVDGDVLSILNLTIGTQEDRVGLSTVRIPVRKKEAWPGKK